MSLRRTQTLSLAALLLMGASLSVSAPAAVAATNPFAQPSPLPFQAPDFSKIKDSDYLPAFEEGMKRQRAEIARIADNPAPPTFDNTLVAMEKSGRMLDRVLETFFGVDQADSDATLNHVQAVVAPQLAAQEDTIYLNSKLFARVKAIYSQRAHLNLDPESRQLLKVYYQQFVHDGADLLPADKRKMKKLNEREATLETEFQQKLVAASNAGAFVTSNEADLAGLSKTQIAAAAAAAKAHGLSGKWLIPLQNTTQQPVLAELTNRAVRKKIFENSWMRAERGDANDTRKVIAELAKLRAVKAKLLGYPNYADYELYDQMAKTPQNVQRFLGQLIGPAATKAASEVREIQAMIKKDGQNFKLEPWDWEYYSEQVRKAKYNIDSSELRPYFELNRVLEDGVFYAAHELYGVTFKERHDLPVYQKDVRVFEVFDNNGTPLGLIYFDYFKRDNKEGGAWMSNFVQQSKLLGTKAVVYNVANFTKPWFQL